MTSALLWVHCLSPLHAGAGTSPGVIDNVIQREVHTGWPMISGATIKGALRHQLQGVLKKDYLLALFGPEASGASEYAGCASFGDAQIVWFPTRAVQGGFALVTNREVQERLLRLARIAGVCVEGVKAFGSIDPNRAVMAGEEPEAAGAPVGVESFVLEVDFQATDFTKWLLQAAIDPEEHLVRKRIEKSFLSVGTEVFDYLITYSTFVETRVSIDDTTGTAKDSLLFSTESVPCETLFCLRLEVADSRAPGPHARENSSGTSMKGPDLFEKLAEFLHNKIFEVGGDVSVGRGLVQMRLQRQQDAHARGRRDTASEPTGEGESE